MNANAIKNYDLCVVGTDPSGLSLAQVYALLGFRVAVVTHNETTALAKDIIYFSFFQKLQQGHNFKQAQAKALETQKQYAEKDIHLSLRAMGVHFYCEEGNFDDRDTLYLPQSNSYIKAKKFLLALGSTTTSLSIPGIENITPLTFDSLLELKSAPHSITLYGTHLDSVEMAQALAKWGCSVHIISPKKILPQEDEEVRRLLISQCLKHGVQIYENCTIESIDADDKEMTLSFNTDQHKDASLQKIRFDEVMFMSNSILNVANMGLSKANISYSPQRIQTNFMLRTTNPRVYATGICATGAPYLRTGDIHTGFFIKNTLFKMKWLKKPTPLSYTYLTEPSVFKFGLSEQEASMQNHSRIRVYRLPYIDGIAPVLEGDTDGFIKIITDFRGRVLGGIIVGKNALYIGQSWLMACKKKLKIADVASLGQSPFSYTELNKKLAANALLPSLLADKTKKLVRLFDRFG